MSLFNTIITTGDQEVIERCINRIALTVLIAASVAQQPDVFLDAKFKCPSKD